MPRRSSNEGMDMRKWRVAGVSFEHVHMGDLLRQVYEHPNAEIVGIADAHARRMQTAIGNFAIPSERVFTDVEGCVAASAPDLVIVCSATARHADYVERLAPLGVHILVEKPFAASLAEADRMIAATAGSGKIMAINWPLAWYPSHVTAKRLVEAGSIGRVVEVHYYDGNRGPLYHVADKVVVDPAAAAAEKAGSWLYSKAAGGGSLLDYLGYGVTLGTWFMNGRSPLEVTAVVDQPNGLEVDEHSITVCRYADGLSKFETRWGTFSDPWTQQPQPKCGFVLVGTEGTLSSYDFESVVRLQTRAAPAIREVSVDELAAPRRQPIEYVLHCLESGEAISGPLDPQLSRIGQQIVDAAVRSATEKRTVRLVP
jgi:glucose-fructose oxidoreductase